MLHGWLVVTEVETKIIPNSFGLGVMYHVISTVA